MADLTISVAATGAEQAAGSLDRVGSAANRAGTGFDALSRQTERSGSTWDRVSKKFGSGEVLRNAAASTVLLANGSASATDKVAALGGALASIPGPVGAIAAVVALGASAWSAWTKSAEEAAKQAAETAAAIEAATGVRDKAMAAVAARASSTALALGADVRLAGATGADPEERKRLQRLNPNDPGFALRGAAALAESGLTGEGRGKVLEVLDASRAIGEKITGDHVTRAISTVAQDQANRAPISEDDAARAARARASYAANGGGIFGSGFRRGTGDLGSLSDLVADTTQMDPDKTRARRAGAMGIGARITEVSLSRAEAPAVAESGRAIDDAARGAVSSAVTIEALGKASKDTSASLEGLTSAARAADEALRGLVAKRDAAAGDRGGVTFPPPGGASP